MKLKLHTWRTIAALAISFALPAAAEGGKQSRDVVAAGKGGTTTMEPKPTPKPTPKPIGRPILGSMNFEHYYDKASPVIMLKRSSKKPEQKPLTKKAVGLSDAKDPKQTRQAKPVVRAQALAAKSNAKRGGTKKPIKGIKFDGIDGEFQDKDHKNWSIEQSFHQ